MTGPEMGQRAPGAAAGPYRIEPVRIDDIDWAALDARPERTVFQTRAWLDFLVDSQAVRPVVARVLDGERPVGWFTGATSRRFGIPVLGSPFPGWTTAYMGFDLDPGVARPPALAGLAPMAFRDLRCAHVEIMDRWLHPDDGQELGYEVTTLPGWEVDLRPDLADISATMSHSARWAIGRAEREGISVHAVDPTPEAADRFHGLLDQSFARRGRVPTYPASRVRSLFAHLGPAGALTMLEARTADERPVAAIVLVHHGRSGHLWGAGSDPESHRLSPNEALHWQAITRLRAAGHAAYDLGGGGTFKAKFGGTPLAVPWFRKSRWAAVGRARDLAARAQRRQQRSARPGPA